MSIAIKMLGSLLDKDATRHTRIEAVATIGMWFAAGAFVTSTVTSMIAGGLDTSPLIDVAGGATAAVIALILKAV